MKQLMARAQETVKRIRAWIALSLDGSVGLTGGHLVPEDEAKDLVAAWFSLEETLRHAVQQNPAHLSSCRTQRRHGQPHFQVPGDPSFVFDRAGQQVVNPDRQICDCWVGQARAILAQRPELDREFDYDSSWAEHGRELVEHLRASGGLSPMGSPNAYLNGADVPGLLAYVTMLEKDRLRLAADLARFVNRLQAEKKARICEERGCLKRGKPMSEHISDDHK